MKNYKDLKLTLLISLTLMPTKSFSSLHKTTSVTPGLMAARLILLRLRDVTGAMTTCLSLAGVWTATTPALKTQPSYIFLEKILEKIVINKIKSKPEQGRRKFAS